MILNNHKKLIISIFGICILTSNFTSYAKDYGVRGPSHVVGEQGFLEMIGERLKRVDTQKEKEEMQAKVRKRVVEPIAVARVTPASKARVYYHDPSYILDKDIVLPNKEILHSAGTIFNPLDQIDLDRKLYFVDAREKGQIDWLKKEIASYQSSEEKKLELTEEVKIILVGGAPLDLEQKLGLPIYFDQGGELTKKFNIKHSPAILEQDGKMLKIEEIKVRGR